MSIERVIFAVAGAFVMISLALGVKESPLYISQWWLAFTFFVGFNLFQSAFTQFCPLAIILKKAGLRGAGYDSAEAAEATAS